MVGMVDIKPYFTISSKENFTREKLKTGFYIHHPHRRGLSATGGGFFNAHGNAVGDRVRGGGEAVARVRKDLRGGKASATIILPLVTAEAWRR